MFTLYQRACVTMALVYNCRCHISASMCDCSFNLSYFISQHVWPWLQFATATVTLCQWACTVQIWCWRFGECMLFLLRHLLCLLPSTATSCHSTHQSEITDSQSHSKIQPQQHSVWSCTSFGQTVIFLYGIVVKIFIAYVQLLKAL